MWRMTPRLATATLTATTALALAFAGVPSARAASVQSYNYSTQGSISTPTGVAPIYFQGVNSGLLTAPGTFSLGQFDAAATLPPTATLTYVNTPFNVTVSVANAAGTYTYYQYMISGVLNGSINGVGGSNMVATATSITGSPAANINGLPSTPPFPASALTIYPQGITAPYTPTGTDGYTTLYGHEAVLGLPAPAPEPSTIAVFGLALAGWACHRRSRAKGRAMPRA